MAAQTANRNGAPDVELARRSATELADAGWSSSVVVTDSVAEFRSKPFRAGPCGLDVRRTLIRPGHPQADAASRRSAPDFEESWRTGLRVISSRP